MNCPGFAIDSGNESGRIRSDQFFDVQIDPVYDHPVETADGYWLVTHNGQAFNVSQEGSQIHVSDAWSLLTEEDAEEKWRPGGGQLKTAHQSLGLGYILMHQGKEYTHHESGSEIWVFDLAAQRRIARIELEVPASDIMVTQEAEPLLLVVDDESGLHVYNAITMKRERTMEDSGPRAALLVDF